MLLFHAAHHHAQVLGLADHPDAGWLDGALDCFRHLLRETFLDLQAAGENVDDPRRLAQADDLFLGDVGDVHAAEERQHVVLAQREDLDILDDHHLVVGDVEHGRLQHFIGVLAVALGQLAHHLRVAHGSFAQAVPVNFLAQASKNVLCAGHDWILRLGAGLWEGAFRGSVRFERFHGKCVVSAGTLRKLLRGVSSKRRLAKHIGWPGK